MKKFLSLLLICIGLFLVACESETDDGVRESIDGENVDWSYFAKEGNEEQIHDIQLDEKSIDNIKDYPAILALISENHQLISSEEADGMTKVYVRFNKVGKLSQAYENNDYDGKETTFYLDKSIFVKYK